MYSSPERELCLSTSNSASYKINTTNFLYYTRLGLLGRTEPINQLPIFRPISPHAVSTCAAQKLQEKVSKKTILSIKTKETNLKKINNK